MSKPNKKYRRSRNRYNKNKKKIILISVIIIALLIIVGVVVFINNRDKSDTVSNNTGEVKVEKLVLQTEKLDKSALKNFIKDIEKFDKQEFTEESYENMEKVVKSAKKTLRKFNLKQDDIDIAFANLVQAVQNLEYKEQ